MSLVNSRNCLHNQALGVYHLPMSISAAQYTVFYKEVSKSGNVFSIKDAGGFPAPYNTLDKERAMPFWSLRSRAQKVIDSVPAYKDFEPVEITLQEFKEKWLPGLKTDGLLVGINWSGESATGYDLQPEEVLSSLSRADESDMMI